MTVYFVGRLPLRVKIALALRAWFWFIAVVVLLRTRPLPRVVQLLGVGIGSRSAGAKVRPARLGAIVGRLLRLRHKQARCLIGALVLYRLLAEQGTAAQLVIGLPPEPTDHRAHAWIEVDHVDVGPPPGRSQHAPLARYG